MSSLILPSTHYAHFRRCRRVLNDPQYWLLLYVASQPQRWHVRSEMVTCGAFKCSSPSSSAWLLYVRPMAKAGLLRLERRPDAPSGGYAARILPKGLQFLGFAADVQEVASA